MVLASSSTAALEKPLRFVCGLLELGFTGGLDAYVSGLFLDLEGPDLFYVD